MPMGSNNNNLQALEKELTTSEFYTSKGIYSIDDESIMTYIFQTYPDFELTFDTPVTKDDEKNLRNILLEIVSNKPFIQEIMKRYSVDIQEIFRVICKKYSFIFNSILYIRKIQSILSENAY